MTYTPASVVGASTPDEGIRCIHQHDSTYPRLLREITPTPKRLFVRGTDITQEQILIAVVGTRRCTAYGKRVLDALIPALVAQGIGIVSGLAFGIDAYAHELTLRHGGYTIAVLPGSVDTHHIFPTSHYSLATHILSQGGTLLAENPPGTDAQPFCFPVRNRIIAGLTVATLVIEAPEHSGALITAQQALEYNRLVAAVPGSVFTDASRGTNALVRRGAYVITCAEDVFDMLGISVRKNTDTIPPTIPDDLREILCLFSALPLTIDAVAGQTQLPVQEITRIITSLEMRGLLTDVGGHRYIRSA